MHVFFAIILAVLLLPLAFIAVMWLLRKAFIAFAWLLRKALETLILGPLRKAWRTLIQIPEWLLRKVWGILCLVPGLPFGGKLIVASASMAIVSLFYGWVEVYLNFWKLIFAVGTYSGFKVKAVAFLSIWLYPLLKVFSDKAISKMWGVLLAFLVMFVAVAFSFYVSSRSGWIVKLETNAGVIMFFVSGILLLFGVLLYKVKEFPVELPAVGAQPALSPEK